MRRALAIVAMRVIGEMRKRIQKRASRGNRYKRGRRWHYASLPGMTPNTDTGNLVSSIITDAGGTRSRPVVFIRVMAKYARALEFGSAHRRGKRAWVVAPRPFVRPVLRDLGPWIHATIREALGKGGAR
jgi:hypothetical protein